VNRLTSTEEVHQDSLDQFVMAEKAAGQIVEDGAKMPTTNPDATTNHNKPPLRYVQVVSQNPKLTFAGWCGCCGFFLVLALIGNALRPLFIAVADVPFYVQGTLVYKRQDALKEAKSVATSMPTKLTPNTTQSFRTRESFGYHLKIIYEAPAESDIWDLKYLKAISNLEQKIIQATGQSKDKVTRSYSQYCQLAYRNGTSVCRPPSSAISFLWEKWVPVPFAAIAPYSMWAHPRQNYSTCTLPASNQNRRFYTDPVLNSIASLLPANASPQAVLDAVISGDVCAVARNVTPHLVNQDGTCERFRPCWSLVYNMGATSLWARTTNQMWDYSQIETYHKNNYHEFVDYWSTYGSPNSPFTSTATYNNTRFVWAPFVSAKTKQTDSGTRQMFPTQMPNLIRQVADATFGYPGGGKTGKALLSVFYFGSPLTNINSAWTEGGGLSTEAWNQDVQTWMFNAFHKTLMDERKAKPEGLSIVWSTMRDSFNPMYSAYIVGSILPSDMRYLLAAISFVFIYIVAMKRSFFLASMALLMIFINMIPTVALYMWICRQTYIGMLQILSLFIIMGIGADNVFVLLDCYEADRKMSRPLEEDLSAAWRHASKAMLCTSLTTFFSFLANARSPFPAISTFGLWCCCLIVANFIAVNTFYLSAVSIFDCHFAKKKMCCIGNHSISEKPSELEACTDRCEFNTRPARFFASKFHPFINKLKIPLVLLWLVLTVVYIFFALKLEPDPNVPSLLPKEDPYAQYPDQQIQHFGALHNPYRIKVEIVIGISRDDPINREGSDPVKIYDRGTVNWVNISIGDAGSKHMQEWIVSLCDDLAAKAQGTSPDEGLRIASSRQVGGQNPVKCPWQHLKTWAQAHGWEYPQPTTEGLFDLLGTYLVQPQPNDPAQINFANWQDYVFWTSDDLRLPKLLRLEVWLNAQSTLLYKDGLSLADHWTTYVDKWRKAAPTLLQNAIFYTDKSVFHYFTVQQTITRECYSGIVFSLALAYIVLLLATLNVVVASCAILSISSIVASVMAFAYWLQWKLGMLEAIIFVMVIGMSVDYVVHMSDAYLQSVHTDRAGRSRFMLGKMGMSVLSGAVTTLGAAFFMTFAYITFFYKFGLVILFTIAQSLITALFFFSAQMALFGPENSFGVIPLSTVVAKLSSNLSHASSSSKQQERSGKPDEEAADEAPGNPMRTQI